MTELKDFQAEADKIVRVIDEKLGVKRDNNVAFIQLFEEIGELVRQPSKENIRKEKIDLGNLGEELADVMILISNIASMNGVDLEEEINKKIDGLKRRHDL